MAGNTVGSARIELVPDLTGFHRKASREIRQMPDLTAEVRLVPDVSGFRADAQRELDRVGPLEVDVHLNLDAAQARRDLRRMERTIPPVRVGVEADVGGAEARIRATARNRRATVDVDADTGAATVQVGILGLAVSMVGGAAVASGIALRQMGASAVMAGVSGAAAIALIGVAVFALIGLVGLAAGAIGILGVGILGLGVAAVPALGAIALGFEGIKKAAESAKFGFDTLKTAMTSVLEETMRPGFAALGELMASIVPQAQNVGRAFGEVFTSISTLLRDDLMGELRTMMDGMATFFRASLPGLETMVIGFMNLGAVFGENAHLIGQGFGEMLGHLGAVFTRLESMGVLQSLFQALGPLLASIGNVVGQMVEGLALAGVAVLPVLTPLMNSLAAVMAPLGQALGAVGAAFGEVLIALLPVLQPISALLVTLAPVLADALVPVAEKLVEIVTLLAPILGDLITTLAPVISTVLVALGDALVVLMPVIGEVLGLVAELIVQYAPLLVSLITALAPLLPPIAQIFMDLVRALLPLMPEIIGLVTDILPLLAFTITIVTQVVRFLAWFIIPFLVLGLQGIIDVVRRVIGWVTSVMDWWKRFGVTLQEFGADMGRMKDTVVEKGRAILGWFQSLPDRIKEALAGAGQWLTDIGSQIVEGLKNGILNKGDVVKRAILSLVPDALEGPLKKALGIESPSKLTTEIGEFTGQGLALGLENTIPEIQAKSELLAAAAAPGVSPTTTASPVPQITATASVAPAGPVDATGMAEAVEAALGGVAAPAWEAYGSTVSSVQSAVLAPSISAAGGAVSAAAGVMRNALAGADASVRNTGNVMASTVNSRMVPVWQNAGNAIRNVQAGPMDTAFRETRNAVTYTADTFRPAADMVATHWNRVREGTAAPVRWSIHNVFNDGVVGSWNSVSDLLGTKKLGPYPVRFATGGEVPGQGNYDRVPALLMPGEFVLRKSVTQEIGADNLARINQGKDPQGALPNMRFADVARRFSAGGLVPGSPGYEKIKRGYDWARSRSGRPYVWGGSANGAGGTDCSGYMSGIADVIGGGDGRRQWATMAFNGQSPGPQGFVKGLMAGFSIGVVNGGPYGGHTAGTIGGLPGLPAVNVESGGAPSMVKFGPGAVGADHGQFSMRYHLPVVGDQVFVTGGAGGGPSMSSLVAEKTDPIWKNVAAKVAGVQFPGQTQPIPAGYMKSYQGATDKKIRELADAMSSFSDPGGEGVQRWRPLVETLLKKYGHPLSLADTTLRRMNQESGGNPRAINNWDSNAKAGIPSKGLMQVIDPTFQAHRDPTLANDIWDPMANVGASMRYAMSRYGSLSAAYNRSGGYDAGGWLDPGISTIYNGFTKPEAILSPAESERFVNIADAFLDANMAGGSFVGQHVENQYLMDVDEVQAKSRRGVRRAMKEAGIR